VLVDGVVVTVVVATEDDVCVDELAALAAELSVLEELPQPAIPSVTRAQISEARMCITWVWPSCRQILPAMPSSDPPNEPAVAADTRALGRIAGAIARWDPYLVPQLVVACAIGLDLALPQKVTIGPSWLLPSFEGLLLLGLSALTPHPKMRYSPGRRYGALALIALVSAVNTISLILLCHYLLGGRSESGRNLILAGVVLWVTNVLLFGLWFWQLDRGGPLARRSSPGPPDFLFPQMSEPKLTEGWEPNLIDYLYVSFTNATAFSPTDAMPLSRTAKVLMAGQALSALVTVGLVVARAVNILN
jgi:hypothetical protein